ncbi:MAG: hypothetical protein JNK87_12665 [Bryobacterales bacterium]|nr:hypothetical protein [Bryobacterales bacterium]
MKCLACVAVLFGLFTSHAAAMEPSELRQLLKRPRVAKFKGEAREASGFRDTFITDSDIAFPFVVNGDGVATKLQLINFEAREVEYEIFFLDDEGFPIRLPIRDRGNVSSFKARISNLGSTTIETTATGDLTIAWAFFDAGTNKVAGNAVLELGTELGIFAASYPAQFFGDKRVKAYFDNTRDNETDFSIVNISTSDAEVAVTLRGEDGSSMKAETIRITSLGVANYTPADASHAARGARGTIDISYPAGQRGGVAVLGIQFYSGDGGLVFHPGFTIE